MLVNSELNSPYRNKARTYNLINALIFLAKCSKFMWYKKQDVPIYHFELNNNGKKIHSKPFNVGMVAYIASELIANARGDQLFGVEGLNESIDFINSDYPGRIEYDNSDPAFRGIQLLLSQIYPQFSLPTGIKIINQFGRYMTLYCEICNQPGTRSMPKYMKQFKNSFEGITIEEYPLIGMVIFALALLGEGKIDPDNIEDAQINISGLNISSQKIKYVLDRVSTSPEEFKVQMNKKVSNLVHGHTLLNPLLRYPVIKIDNEYYSPVPQLIIQRTTEGIYEDLKDLVGEKEKSRLFTSLGFVFEKYIKLLVEQTNKYKRWKIWSDQEYDNGSFKSVDLIIQDNDTVILIECKTQRMSKQVKTFMDENKYHQELEEIAHGIEEIIRTAKHIKEGRLVVNGLRTNIIRCWIGIVITFDEYILRPNEVTIINSENYQSNSINTKPIWDHFMKQVRERINKSPDISIQDLDAFPQEQIMVYSLDEFEFFLGSYKLGIDKISNLKSGKVSPNIHPYHKRKFLKYWEPLKKSLKKVGYSNL